MLTPILRVAARTTVPVLLTGETGTGKSHTARLIHDASPRAREEFVVVNCAAIPTELFEDALFGHERGAFTGATKRKLGFFREADGGTLFLDELAEVPARLQAKLLTALETGTIRPVGADADVKVNVRIIAATHSPHLLRDDLRERLRVTHHVPALRERPDALPGLVDALLRDVEGEVGVGVVVDPDALDALTGYAWPGNIRELLNVLVCSALQALYADPDAVAPLVTRNHVEAALLLSRQERERVEEARRRKTEQHLHVHLTLDNGELRALREVLAACDAQDTVTVAVIERAITRHTERRGADVDTLVRALLSTGLLERVGTRYRVTQRGVQLARAP